MHARSFPWIKPYSFTTSCSKSWCSKLSTIPDKTTWESFTHHVHFPTQQNYFEKKTPSPNSMLLSTNVQGSGFLLNMLSGEGGEGRTGKATMFRKMLSKYTIFSTVLSKIVAYLACNKQTICNGLTDHFTKVATQIHYNAHTQISLYYQAWEGRHLPHVITKNPSLALLMQAPEPQYAL